MAAAGGLLPPAAAAWPPGVDRCCPTAAPLLHPPAGDAEIEEAVTTARDAGCTRLALLKCTTDYPADPADANLRTMPDLMARARRAVARLNA